MQFNNQTTESNTSYVLKTEDDHLVSPTMENIQFKNVGISQKKSEFSKLKMNFMGEDSIKNKTLLPDKQGVTGIDEKQIKTISSLNDSYELGQLKFAKE